VGEGGETEDVDLVVGNNITAEEILDDSDAEEPCARPPNKKIKKLRTTVNSSKRVKVF